MSMFLSRATCMYMLMVHTCVPRKTDIAVRVRVLSLPRPSGLAEAHRVAESSGWPSLNSLSLLVIVHLLAIHTLLFLTTHRHTTNKPTIKPQWPPNASPTSSPTSLPAARALWSKCTRLPFQSPLLPQTLLHHIHMANMSLTAHLQQHLPEPR
jgi:hypothetical protein